MPIEDDIQAIADYHDRLAIKDTVLSLPINSVLLERLQQVADKEGIPLETWVLITLESTVAQESD